MERLMPWTRDALEPSEELLKSEDYLVWSHEHGAWWASGGYGYAKGLMGAGRFTRDQALTICRDAIPSSASLGAIAEIPVRLADVAEFSKGQIVPMAFMKGTR
jgi:hypothetical protein